MIHEPKTETLTDVIMRICEREKEWTWVYYTLETVTRGPVATMWAWLRARP